MIQRCITSSDDTNLILGSSIIRGVFMRWLKYTELPEKEKRKIVCFNLKNVFLFLSTYF